MHFVRTLSISAYSFKNASYTYLMIVAYCNQRGSKLWKNCIGYIKNVFENGWLEDLYPSSYSLDPPLAISYRNHQNSLAYFNHLAPLNLFFFNKKQSQKGERAWNNAPSPKYALAVKTKKKRSTRPQMFYEKSKVFRLIRGRSLCFCKCWRAT